MRLTRKKISLFQRFIFAWWAHNKRDLPWRHTHDPYKIMVSEIMLQQTQVERVIPKYKEFIYTFPTVRELAKAPASQVLRLWKGMGYNRRALYLKRASEYVVDIYNGRFPKTEKKFIQLPGVGKYTARAIMIFAYRENISTVDTNIRQIITHHFFFGEKKQEKVIEKVAEQLVPIGKSWEWHQALMDYGSCLIASGTLQSKKIKKKQQPFRESNRFFRGRIIDILRENSMAEDHISAYINTRYQKDKKDILAIIESLVKDGLVVKNNGTLMLPQ